MRHSLARSQGPRRRLYYVGVAGLIGVTLNGVALSPPATPRLTASGTTSSSPIAPCTIDGLIMTPAACPSGTMTLAPTPALVSGVENFTISAYVPAMTSLPLSATTSWGATITFSGSGQITWSYPGGTIIVEFENTTAPGGSVPAPPSCPYWDGLTTTTGFCAETDTSTADSCDPTNHCTWTIPHRFSTTTGSTPFYPVLIVNGHSTLPYAMPLATQTLAYQQLTPRTVILPQLAGTDTWYADSYPTVTTSFTNHTVQDNYASYQYAGPYYSATTDYIDHWREIYTLCRQCGGIEDTTCEGTHTPNGTCNGGEDSWAYNCANQPWANESGESYDQVHYTGSECWNASPHADSDDIIYHAHIYHNNTLSPYANVPIYKTGYKPDYYPPQTGTYDNQTVAAFSDTYLALSPSACDACVPETQVLTLPDEFSDETPVNYSGTFLTSTGTCSDPGNLSDLADWNSPPTALLPACQPTFYTTPQTTYALQPTPYDSLAPTAHPYTSQDPPDSPSTQVSYQTLAPATASYTAKWLTGATSYRGGYSTMYNDYEANGCNYDGSAPSDGDGGDGDGPNGVLHYYNTCNYQNFPIYANGWNYTSYSVASGTYSYSYSQKPWTSVLITTPDVNTGTYYTQGTQTGTYNQLVANTYIPQLAVASPGGAFLSVAVIQEQGIQ